MDLRALLAGLTSAAVPQVPEVTGVCCDSQRIRPGDVFVAIPGFREDGRCHIAEAKARGAVCVLSREPVQELPWAVVQDPRRALAEVSARLYRHPDRELAVVGVTGTNGKTTTTCLVRHILRQTLGVRVGLIGTIRNLIDETELETERTTPESCDVYRLLRQMADAGCRYGVMEVSSHALALERVRGITFRVGAFTNLTRDHLDFHRTMEDYCDAKAQLFRQCEAAVCNGDDPWTPRLLRECACPVLRYGTGDSSRLRGENLRLTARSVAFDALLDGRRIPVTVSIPGRFTVYNALAALGICHMLGVPPEQGAAALQTASGIKGRMEVVPTPGLPCTVLIDYAHTPDALENVLTAVRGFAEGRVVAVFQGDTYLSELTLLRQQSAEVIRQTTTGIRVPKEALRVRERTVTDEDGNESVVSETGVYCMVGMKARFKPVDVLYSGDDFALVRSTLDTAEEVSKTQEQIRLRAGDEVIITAYDLYDGKVIGS